MKRRPHLDSSAPRPCSRPSCTRAGQLLPPSEFHASKQNADGLRSDCKECCRIRNAKRNAPRPMPPPPPASDAGAAADAAGADFDIDIDPAVEARALHEQRTVESSLRREHRALLEENQRLRGELDFVAALRDSPQVEFHRAVSATRGDAVACLLASDWHVEEPVERAHVHGLNEYSPEIARDRAQHFFANGLRLTDMMARESTIDTLWLGLLGDFFSGYIHEELQEENAMAPADAAQHAQSLLQAGIDFLLRESSYRLEIDCVHGNHGRMTKKMRIGGSAGTSLESFMYRAIAGRYEGNPRVSFRVAPGKMLYRRFFERFNMRIIHGDDVKFGGGVGGVTIPIRKKLAAWNQAVRADLTVMGHFHQLLDGGDFKVNGSLIGYNEFAQAIGASPEEARQAFFLVHARGGGQPSIHAPVWLTDRPGGTE